MKRRISKPIRIGNVTIGGDAPVVVQSMTKTDTRDVKATIRQIKELEDYGCEIVRLAITDKEAAAAILGIKKNISIPLIADIHFDYRLALAVLENGIDGLRLNPGNINDPKKITAIVKSARERSIPIRIGVNGGSLPAKYKPDLPLASRMVSAAIDQIKQLESLDFDLIKISLKAFDVPVTIAAYEEIAQQVSYPLHVGITEAGTTQSGIIRSAVGIGSILSRGLGDTIRVSLSAPPEQEVITAYEILKSLNLRQHGPILVSCPTCGRCEVNLVKLAESVDKELKNCSKPLKVAVMGCAVNGPGEAMDADIGVACGKGKGILFKKGKKVRIIEETHILDELLKEIERL